MMKRILVSAFLVAAASSCGVTNPDSALKDDSQAYTGFIRVSLKHPADAAKNDYSLLFSASQTTLGLGVCVAKKTPTCTVGGAGYFAAKLVYNDGKKNFFMPNSSAILEDGLVLTVVGTDKDGNVIDQRNVKFVKGSGSGTVASDTPSTPTTTTTSPATSTPSTTATNTPWTTPTNTTPTNNGGGNGGGGNFGGGGGGW